MWRRIGWISYPKAKHGGVGLLVWPLDFKSSKRGFGKAVRKAEPPFFVLAYGFPIDYTDVYQDTRFCVVIGHLYGHHYDK